MSSSGFLYIKRSLYKILKLNEKTVQVCTQTAIAYTQCSLLAFFIF